MPETVLRPARKQCLVCRVWYISRHTCRGTSHRLQPLSRVWRDDSECRLFQYYVQDLCSQRTLYTTANFNSYLNAIQTSNEGVAAAIFALAAAYRRDASLEAKYTAEVLKYLLEALSQRDGPVDPRPIIQIIQLMIHYHVVTQFSPKSWPFHSRALAGIQRNCSINYEASLFVTYESILKLTHPDSNQLANDGISIDYLLSCENPTEIRDFGCSRQVLHILGSINDYETKTRTDPEQRTSAGHEVLLRCDGVEQVAPEANPYRRSLIEKIAESYLHVARIIIYCRLLGYTRRNPELREAADSLALLLLDIPTHGTWFTAQYPLASAFWCIIFSPIHGGRCYEILRGIWGGKPTNITFALDVADKIRSWEDGSESEVEPLWFEHMLESLDISNLSLG